MKSLKNGYLLMLPTLLGLAGFHRFYQGKIFTGILWFLTWGLGGFGTIYDALTLANQLAKVDTARTGQVHHASDYWLRLADSLDDGPIRHRVEQRYGHQPAGGHDYAHRSETFEHAALRIARDHGGWTSTAQLALLANMDADKAKAVLESLVDKGIADIRIRTNGVIAYVFPEFLSPEAETGFEKM